MILKEYIIEVNSISMRFPLPQKSLDYLNPFRERKSFLALDDVNLQVATGDRVAFLGVNGAGKTTLLKLIGGLLYPSKGAIYVDGFQTVEENLKSRKSVGFVLNEERSFYWRLSAKQNLQFFGVLDNLKGKELDAKITELIRLVGLEDSQHKLVATFSSGMKQRLAIARGLLSDPGILILDEPTRTLDPQAVKDIIDLIAEKIHEKTKRTLLIATHRFDEVERLCNKVCVMNEGRLLAFNSLKEVHSNYGTIENYYYSILSKKIICG